MIRTTGLDGRLRTMVWLLPRTVFHDQIQRLFGHQRYLHGRLGGAQCLQDGLDVAIHPTALQSAEDMVSSDTKPGRVRLPDEGLEKRDEPSVAKGYYAFGCYPADTWPLVLHRGHQRVRRGRICNLRQRLRRFPAHTPIGVREGRGERRDGRCPQGDQRFPCTLPGETVGVGQAWKQPDYAIAGAVWSSAVRIVHATCGCRHGVPLPL